MPIVSRNDIALNVARRMEQTLKDASRRALERRDQELEEKHRKELEEKRREINRLRNVNQSRQVSREPEPRRTRCS